MNTYTPCKLADIMANANGVLPNHADIAELAPVCGLSEAAATEWARKAYGEDAAIIADGDDCYLGPQPV